MRPHHFAIGGSLLFATLGIWIGTAYTNKFAPGSYVESPTRYTVTDEMLQRADASKLKDAPSIRFVDAEGETRDVREDLREKPVLLLFIKHDCPCSIEAQPVFNNLARALGGSVQFYGIVNQGGEAAGFYHWSTEMRFPMIADPELKVTGEYGVDRSCTLALLNTEGKIEKIWPGYSKGMLREVNLHVAKLTEREPVEFDDSTAPDRLTAGCSYGTPGLDPTSKS